MVALSLSAVFGWLMFSLFGIVEQTLGWLKAPHFELAPGNIPVPVLPWELPVARVVALPPYPSSILRVVHASYEEDGSINRRVIGRMREIVRAKRRHAVAHAFHSDLDPQSHCHVCNASLGFRLGSPDADAPHR
jgi:hypothetical protein